MRYFCKASLLSALLLASVQSRGQKAEAPFLTYVNHPWVDSVMLTLSPEKKIGQLIWVAAFSNRDPEHEVWLTDQIRDNGIGGVIFFQGRPLRQTELVNYFNKVSEVPPLVVTDGE
ncbi:MAG: beta-N-acetylhexosaminidase, partial [Bacteroidales bacterium]|nr:beta-N-acetylhexosaminidase [Bacteroidales bacterium]